MKKILPICVVGILLFSGFVAAAFPSNDIKIVNWPKNETKPVSSGGDELDQYQTSMDFFGPVGKFLSNPYYIVAQSFIPTKKILTRIQLLIGKNSSTTYPYTVAIREQVTGADIALASVNASAVPTENFSWVNFTFNNVKLTPGNTYWMVSYTANITDNWYVWGLNWSNAYPNGTIAYSMDDGVTWQNETAGDMCFMTYGNDAVPELAIESITSGLGITAVIKNIGDADATNVTCNITIDGGLFVTPRNSLYTTVSLAVNASINVQMFVFGIGLGIVTPLPSIMVTASASDADEVHSTVTAKILGPFVVTT